MELWRPYLISCLIGLLVGVERERAQPARKAMGVRTFLLISVLGAAAGGLEGVWLPALITAFALSAIAASYVLFASVDANDHGLTTEFAAALVFVIAYISHQSPTLAAILGPAVALVLFSKRPLHKFTAVIKTSELQAAILILLLAVTVVGVVEDRVIDPWGIFNPKKFGLLVLILAVLEFLGYILTKLWGEKKGSLFSGFLGGLVSSTAVLLSSAKAAAKSDRAQRMHLISAIAAKCAALVEVLIVVALISGELALRLILPIGAGILAAAILLGLMGHHSKGSTSQLTLRSPLEFTSVLKLSGLLGLILAVVAAAQRWLGVSATQGVVFFTGLFELHGVSLATATMADRGQISLTDAADAIVLATAASLIAKAALAWIIARNAFSRNATLLFLGIGLAIFAGFLAQRVLGL